jgi:hypothetical protein
MKGIYGLILAIGLGFVGFTLNWVYLTKRASQEETVAFVGVKTGKIVNRGDVFHEEDLIPVPIPRSQIGNLKDFAVAYSAKQSVVGQPAWRTLVGQCILLNDDLKTPPKELHLEDGEDAMWIPVDTRTFVPSLVVPGDMVSFMVVRPLVPTPAVRGRPAMPDGNNPTDDKDDGEDKNKQAGSMETIGKFKILAVGNRLGTSEVMRAAKLPQLQENVLTIRVSDHVTGERGRAEQLYKLLQATNFRQVGVLLHPRKDRL